MDQSIESVLAEQVAYYAARAEEYDEWFLRRGRYDHGTDANARWFGEAGKVAEALRTFEPRGDVLELACGTGLWTDKLLESAASVTAVDASDEVLDVHRSRFGERVERIRAAIFAFEPPHLFDTVFFSFWLSHVPPERFSAFWSLVRRCLNPRGRVFFVDSKRAEDSTATNHVLPREGEVLQRRLLNDGRTYQVVKVYYEPEPLQSQLRSLGWDATITGTDRYFIYGWATPHAGG